MQTAVVSRLANVSLTVVALVTALAGLSQLSNPSFERVFLTAVFSVGLIVALTVPFQLALNGEQYLTTVVLFLLILVLPPSWVVLTILIATVLGARVRRVSRREYTLMSARMYLQVLFAMTVLRLFNWHTALPDPFNLSSLFAVGVAAFSFYLTFVYMRAICKGLQAAGTAQVWQAVRSALLPHWADPLLHFSQMAIALVMAILIDIQPLALLALSIPIVAANIAMSQHLRLRRSVENRLKGAETVLREAQRLAHLGSWEQNFETGEQHWSDEMQRITGVDLEDGTPAQERFLSVIAPDDREAVSAALEEALQDGKPKSLDHRIVQQGGRSRAVQTRLEVVLDDDGQPDRLLATMHDITERKEIEEYLTFQAFHDPLTGLPNRALFFDRVEHALIRASRRNHRLAVLFIDLDLFKFVNDTFGHEIGDLALIAVGERIRSFLRPGDTVARISGDEFTVLLDELQSDDQAAYIAERISNAMHEPFDVDGHRVLVTASIGVVVRTSNHQTTEDLLRDADIALYYRKQHGRSGHVVFDPSMTAPVVDREDIELELRDALRLNQLHLIYQPQFNLRTGKVAAVEALLRWEHPRRGTLRPGMFLPIAESTGLIQQIDDWVLREACTQAAHWQIRFGLELPVCVNISSRQLRRLDLVEMLRRILRETDCSPEMLRLELHETALMAEPTETVAILRQLREMGVKVILDNFGVGFSSLMRLKRLPVDTLKVDGSLVRNLGEEIDRSAFEIASAVINLAHNLGLQTIAEWVEEPEQVETLRNLNCEYGQGYYLSEPMTGEQFDDFLNHTVSEHRLRESIG